jgi:CRP/FNR family transcriptional regulator
MKSSIHISITKFFSTYPQRSYTKNETLIWNDENPPGIFYLESGSVGQYDIGASGQKNILNIFKPPAFFPMSWAINESKNEHFFEALEPVTCRLAPRYDVLGFLEKNPKVTLDLLGRVYRGTDGLLKRLNESMTGNAQSQLITELIITASRFGSTDQNGNISIQIKTTELAQRTGLTRETVSRQLKLLNELSLIQMKKGVIFIPSLSELQAKLRFI